MWLIIPLVYVLAWKQSGSWRQAFNATIAWIIGFMIVASIILALDMGGYGGVRAMPDSPAAGVAFLGGFVGMWISILIWKRRGGDPPRKPGRWERAFRAVLGGSDKKKTKKKRRPAPPAQSLPPHPAPPPGPQQPQPVDAQYRPINQQPAGPPQYQPAQPAPPPQSASSAPHPEAPPAQPGDSAPYAPYPQQPPPQPANNAGYQHDPQQAPPPPSGAPYAAPGPPPSAPPPQQPPPQGATGSRQSPTANKYAKATGRALGAMFRGSGKKKTRRKS